MKKESIIAFLEEIKAEYCKQIEAYLLRLKNKIKETDRNVSMLDYTVKVLRK